MSIKERVQEWLMIPTLHHDLRRSERRDADLLIRMDQLDVKLSALSIGVARLIAKLDPRFGVPEDDKARKAESNNLSQAVMNRLIAEHLARQHSEGKA